MQEFAAKLKKAKTVWIYGAGTCAVRAVEFLSQKFFRLPIAGITVSRNDGKKEKFAGYDICELREIDTPDDTSVFVIAVSVKYQQEIIEELKNAGYHNYVIWNAGNTRHMWNLAEYRFENRSKKQKKVCLVLSGYKDFLWEDVFGRLEKFVPMDIDVCLVSCGLYDKRLSERAQKNEWSYLCTGLNDITMIQNIGISLFEHAEWIYKLDEDIFLTERCFEKLYDAYRTEEESGQYHVGFTVPLIPVNGYGYIRILERLGILKEYERLFGRAYYGGDSKSMIEMNPDAAKFMWGFESSVPLLDELNSLFEENDLRSYCSTRFSIGFLLFKRQLWDAMGGFSVTGDKDLGRDEIELSQYCVIRSMAAVVAENTVVGHFSFGNQTQGMRKLYETNPELFRIGRKK